MRCLVLALALVVTVWPALTGEAHKPILSPYTYAEHAGPIFKARCAGCHAPGGVAPMSLLTAEDATPWAESIRLELIAGHMPPWGNVTPADRFRGSVLTASELNTLLVWAAGGTPPGSPLQSDREPPAAAWPLGEPNLTLKPAAPFSMSADTQDQTVEFRLPTNLGRDRLVRAVDVRPSTPSVVRSATVRLGSTSGDAEALLALWLPGDEATRLPEGTAFLVPAGASLVLSMHYRKSWKQERDTLSDTPSIGLYFADPNASIVTAIPLSAPVVASDTVTISRTLERDVSLLALYPDTAMQGVVATVRVTKPNGRPELLMAARPRDGWTRRYWLRDPVQLPRGTRIDVAIAPTGDDALLPPGLTRTARPASAGGGLTLNGVAF